MRSCNHVEADTQILIHVKDALAKGGRSVLVRAVDTDVLVILIAQFLSWGNERNLCGRPGKCTLKPQRLSFS